MANARDEFIAHVGERRNLLLCAEIRFDSYKFDEPVVCALPLNYTHDQLEEFLESLDFEYDNGYGTQHLYGTIWYAGGTWSDRYEYDGSESWAYQSCPPIPDSLR